MQIEVRDGYAGEQAKLEGGAINDEVRIVAGGKPFEQRIGNDAAEDLGKKSAADNGERADEKVAERDWPRREACRLFARGRAEHEERPHDQTGEGKDSLGRERGGEDRRGLVGHYAQGSCNP
jgi:hypothetical protein